MDEFFTWTVLATYAGSMLATTLLTQFLKGLIAIKTQLLSLIIAFVVLISSTAFTAGLTLESALLCLINAVVVSLASNGAFHAIPKKTDEEAEE